MLFSGTIAARVYQNLFANSHHFNLNQPTFVIAARDSISTTNHGGPVGSSQAQDGQSMGPFPGLEREPEPEPSNVVKFLMDNLAQKDDYFSELSGLALDINTNIRQIEGMDSQNQEDVAGAACDAVFAAIQNVYSTSQREPHEPKSARLVRLEGLKQTLSELHSFSSVKRLDGTVYSSLPFYNADEKQMKDYSLRLKFHIEELYATDDSIPVESLPRDSPLNWGLCLAALGLLSVGRSLL
ncbi:hypothetical protein PM082_007294 [Marasmius tenuissimus]|nr:hypothetical protein PM082_007294 [Marasmius tenuissimus]